MKPIEIIYYIVAFLISLVIHGFSLFIAAKIFKKAQSHTFGKAFSVIIRVYIVIAVIGFLGWLAIWLLGRYLDIAGGNIINIVIIAVFILSVIYYVRLIAKSYNLDILRAVLLIILMWFINIAILYLIEFIVGSLSLLENMPKLFDNIPGF
jgi:hypothetical protein